MRPIGNRFMAALVKAKVQVGALPVVTGDTESGETDVSTDDLPKVPEGDLGVADDDLDIASYLDVAKPVPVAKVDHAELILAVHELAYDVRMAQVDTSDPRLKEVLVGLDLITKLLA